MEEREFEVKTQIKFEYHFATIFQLNFQLSTKDSSLYLH